jgi:predicted phosphate transport protein (TIGR00153 family)
MTFKKAIRLYLRERRSEDYKKINKQMHQIEKDADLLRRDIENSLYAQNLIPDLRADVLDLVESLDKIINKFDEVVYRFYIEWPDIPPEYHSGMSDLSDHVADCCENMAIASRAFFRNISAVRDYSQKVYFLEHECDITSGRLRKAIYDSDLPLANKNQLNWIVIDAASISDIAEDCIDKLLIFTIKRDI